MNRRIVYGGQIPTTLDLLHAQTESLVALGNFAQDVLFSTVNPSSMTTPTLVAGFAPTFPGGLAVNLAAGRVYQLAQVDAALLGDKPLDARYIIQQGQADVQTLNFTAAPATVGESRIDLVQVKYEVSDDNNAVLLYYNADDPDVPYSGPDNDGSAQATRRTLKATVSIKIGVAAVAPVAPAADAGCVPMFLMTIENGDAAIDATNWSVHGDAPFIGGLTKQHHTGAPGSAPKIDLTSEVQGVLPPSHGGGVLRGVLADRPVASADYDGVFYTVQTPGAASQLQVCMLLGDGATYDWVPLTMA